MPSLYTIQIYDVYCIYIYYIVLPNVQKLTGQIKMTLFVFLYFFFFTFFTSCTHDRSAIFLTTK